MGLPTAWAAARVLDDGEWAEMQVIVKGEEIITEMQTKYDSWDTDDTAAKLVTTHLFHLRQIQLTNVINRITKDKYEVYEP